LYLAIADHEAVGKRIGGRESSFSPVRHHIIRRRLLGPLAKHPSEG